MVSCFSLEKSSIPCAQGIVGYQLGINMADGPAGFHFDELNKVRVLEPEIGQQTQELKEECKEFVDSK